MDHLRQLASDNDTRAEYQHLFNRTSGKWISRSDVIVKYEQKNGTLKVGYGKLDNRFGIEVEFGWYVYTRYNVHYNVHGLQFCSCHAFHSCFLTCAQRFKCD